MEYDVKYITWLQGQKPSSNIHNNVIVHSSLIVVGNENLKYFFFNNCCYSNIPTVRSSVLKCGNEKSSS